MALPQEFLMELKEKNDIESVLSPYVALKRRGGNLVGLCPFHNEKTPSFTVYPENGSYYCFGCGQGGDVITFIMRRENLDYIDAVKQLADRAGLRIPENGEDDAELKTRNAIYDVNRAAARFYHAYMMSPAGKAGLEYFTGRGLTLKTIKHFGLGFAPDDWGMLKNHLRKEGFSEKIMLAADLIVRGQKGNTYDRFRNRAMFPIINLHGKVIGFSGRAMPGNDTQGGKYVNTSDTAVYKKSHNMYALNFAKAVCADRAILVEGNMDVIALHQAGFCSAVAALGTSFTVEQARLLGRYTKEVVLTLDADAAGEKATDRAMKTLETAGVNARVLRLPECKDPDEFIKKNGAARFEALLDGAVSDIEYRLYTAARGIDLDASDGRLQYLRKCCEVLAGLDDPIAIDLYAGKLSSTYGISKDVLLSNTKEVAERMKKQKVRKELNEIVTPKRKADTVNPQKQQFPRAAGAEEAVISVLIKHPDLAERARDALPPDCMVTDFNRRVYEKILEIYDAGREFDLTLLGGEFSPDEIGYVTRILTLGAGKTNAEKELQDGINVILSEKSEMNRPKVTDLSDNDWASAMAELSRRKKKNQP